MRVITRHLATNFRLEWTGGPEARLESLLTVFRSDDATREPVVSVVADVQEVFFTRHEGDTWHGFRKRLTKPVFIHMLS